MNQERKEHWEKVYFNKSPNEVSWTQEKPSTSLEMIASCSLPKTAKIIDVGGGDSKLVDFLLAEGYENITVLDISAKAIEKAKARLGEQAAKVTWIVSDVIDFKPTTNYDLWHDRATFHFLTKATEIEYYKKLVSAAVSQYLVLGTFSIDGPLKCSGLEITQYDKLSMPLVFKDSFEVMECKTEDHLTPFDTMQNFIFCRYSKNKN